MPRVSRRLILIVAPEDAEAKSASGNEFTIERSRDAKTTQTCTQAGVGGCPENGEW